MSTNDDQAKARVYAEATEMARKAALNDHINKTIEQARGALERGRPAAALGYLWMAAPKYIRLGGKVAE